MEVNFEGRIAEKVESTHQNGISLGTKMVEEHTRIAQEQAPGWLKNRL